MEMKGLMMPLMLTFCLEVSLIGFLSFKGISQSASLPQDEQYGAHVIWHVLLILLASIGFGVVVKVLFRN